MKRNNKNFANGQIQACGVVAGIALALAALCASFCGSPQIRSEQELLWPKAQIGILAQPVLCAFAQEWRQKPLPAEKDLAHFHRAATFNKKAFFGQFPLVAWEISSPALYFGLILPPLPPPALA